MNCSSCVLTIEEALTSTDGVVKVSVTLNTKIADIWYDSGKISGTQLQEVIEKAKYGKVKTKIINDQKVNVEEDDIVLPAVKTTDNSVEKFDLFLY